MFGKIATSFKSIDFSKLSKGFNSFTAPLTAFANGPSLTALLRLLAAFAKNPFTLAIAAIAAIGIGVYAVTKQFKAVFFETERIKSGFGSIWRTLGEIVMNVLPVEKTLIVIRMLVEGTAILFRKLSHIIAFIGKQIWMILNPLARLFDLIDKFNGIENPLKDWELTSEAIKNNLNFHAPEDLVKFVQGLSLKPQFPDVARSVKPITIPDIAEMIKTGAQNAWNWVKDVAENMWIDIKDYAMAALDGIINGLGWVWDNTVGAMGNAFNGMLTKITDTLVSYFTPLKLVIEGLTSVIKTIYNIITGRPFDSNPAKNGGMVNDLVGGLLAPSIEGILKQIAINTGKNVTPSVFSGNR
jgi:hypothetical protein